MRSPKVVRLIGAGMLLALWFLWYVRADRRLAGCNGERVTPTMWIRFRINSVVLVLMNLLVASALLIVVARRSLRARVHAADSHAKLDRTVGDVAFDGVPLDQALRVLASRTGTPIRISANIQTRPPAPTLGSWRFVGERWQTPIHGHFHDVSLRATLDALMRQAHNEFTAPLTYEALDDGSIFVGADDEMPQVVRSYPVRDLLDVFNHVQMRQAPLGTVAEGEMPVSGEDKLRDVLMESMDPDVRNATQPGIELRADRLIMIHNRRWCDHLGGVIRELQRITPTRAGGSH